MAASVWPRWLPMCDQDGCQCVPKMATSAHYSGPSVQFKFDSRLYNCIILLCRSQQRLPLYKDQSLQVPRWSLLMGMYHCNIWSILSLLMTYFAHKQREWAVFSVLTASCSSAYIFEHQLIYPYTLVNPDQRALHEIFMYSWYASQVVSFARTGPLQMLLPQCIICLPPAPVIPCTVRLLIALYAAGKSQTNCRRKQRVLWCAEKVMCFSAHHISCHQSPKKKCVL